MPRGGKRPGAGAKKGSQHASTIQKEHAREALRQIVLTHMEQLVSAQLANAMGLSHLFVRDDKGKFVQITDPSMIETVLNSGEQDKYFYIHTKDPSIQAFTDLMNRAIDKPADQVQAIEHSGSLTIKHELAP